MLQLPYERTTLTSEYANDVMRWIESHNTTQRQLSLKCGLRADTLATLFYRARRDGDVSVYRYTATAIENITGIRADDYHEVS